MAVKFRVELVWKDEDDKAASSLYLTTDGRVIVQGRTLSPAERAELKLPVEAGMISVDRKVIRAIQEML